MLYGKHGEPRERPSSLCPHPHRDYEHSTHRQREDHFKQLAHTTRNLITQNIKADHQMEPVAPPSTLFSPSAHSAIMAVLGKGARVTGCREYSRNFRRNFSERSRKFLGTSSVFVFVSLTHVYEDEHAKHHQREEEQAGGAASCECRDHYVRKVRGSEHHQQTPASLLFVAHIRTHTPRNGEKKAQQRKAASRMSNYVLPLKGKSRSFLT